MICDCNECLNTRLILSENGFHRVCALSNLASRNCIFGKKDHFIQRPKDKDEKEDSYGSK